MDEFISEDDLKTFEGWLRYQAYDTSTMKDEQVATLRRLFDEAQQRCAASPKVGLMELKPIPGEHKYAVAIREGADLWLVLWVRRNRKGEFFVLKPMGDRDWNPHTSYHLDGTRHVKSFGRKVLPPQQRQPLAGPFRGTEDLFMHAGFSPKGVGAICDPSAFTGVVEVPSGVLGPVHGAIAVALAEPGHSPPDYTWAYEIVAQHVFCDITPNVVITIMRQKPLQG